MNEENEVDLIVRFKDEEFWLRYLTKALSVQKNTLINLIGIDNKSIDCSREIIEAAENLSTVKSVKILDLDDFKPGLALNMGAEAGESPFIINLSSHCVPKSKFYCAELIHELKKEASNCAGVFGAQLPLSCSGAQNTIDLILTYPREERIFRRTPIFNNANSVIKRVIFEKYKFDNEVTNLEDFIWAKTILEEGYELKYTPNAAVYHHHGLHQHTHLSGRADKSLKVLIKKKWIEIDNPEFLSLDTKKVAIVEKGLTMDKLKNQNKISLLSKNKIEEVDFIFNDEIFLDFDYFLFKNHPENIDNKDIEIMEECSAFASELSFFNDEILYLSKPFIEDSRKEILDHIDSNHLSLISSRFVRLII